MIALYTKKLTADLPAAAEEAARQVNAWRMRLVRTQAAATRYADMAAQAK